jgi:hypothetical protein
MVPYSGDDEFRIAWSDPRLDLDHPKLGPGERPVRAALPSLGAVDQPGHPSLAVAPEPVVQAPVRDAVVVGPSVDPFTAKWARVRHTKWRE